MQKFVGRLKRSFRDKKGFTLIELIVVIAIIGILVLLAAPKFLGYTKDANVAAMQADAKVLSNAALMYNIDNDTNWPVTVDAVLEADVANVVAALGLVDDVLTTEVNEALDVFAIIDADELDSYVKNTANPIEQYILVTSGDLEGEVFHLGGVEDAEGTNWFGVATKVLAE